MAGNLDAGPVMDSAVASLRSQVSQALVTTGDFNLFADSASQQAVQGNLTQYANKISDLDGRMRADVMSGALTIEAWKGVAATTAAGIASLSGVQVGWGDFWKDVVAKTGTDLKSDVSAVGSASWPFIIAAGVILILVLAIKVS